MRKSLDRPSLAKFHPPVGKRFGVNCAQSKCNWIEIIGVSGDVKELGPAREPVVAMYFPETTSEMTLVIRAAHDPASLRNDFMGIIHSIGAQQPVANIRTMESMVSQSKTSQRLTTLIAGLFAALAFTLAIVGLYGVISYSVAQRLHEFAIRVALGAMKKNILGLIFAHGFRLALTGIVIGLAGSLLVSRAMAKLIFGISPNDPPSLIATNLLLLCATLLGCSVPARRAGKTDPAVALQHE